jgi:hypothetical protein
LYALYSFMVYSPIMRFTLFSTSTMKALALWPSRSLMPNFWKGNPWAAQLTLKYTISVGAQPLEIGQIQAATNSSTIITLNLHLNEMKSVYKEPGPTYIIVVIVFW